MLIKAVRKDLLHALSMCGVAITDSGKKANVTGSVVFRYAGGGLCMLATNKSFVAKVEFDTDVTMNTDDNVFIVNATKLVNIVSNDTSEIVNIEFTDSRVRVRDNDGRVVSFALVRPGSYPYFDNELEAATSVSSVNAGLLRQALSFIRPFVCKDVVKPHLTVTQMRNRGDSPDDNAFIASDSSSMGIFYHPGLTAPIRATFDQVTAILSFLRLLPEESEINISDYGVYTFLTSVDGCVFGFLKPDAAFPSGVTTYPTVMAEPGAGIEIIELSKQALQRHLTIVTTPLEPDDNRLSMCVMGEGIDAKLVLSVTDVTGVESSREMSVIRSGGSGGDTMFPVNFKFAMSILAALDNDDVHMVLDSSNSWVQFSEARGDKGVASAMFSRKR